MARRSSFWLTPAGFVLGYLLALFATTAGVVGFPFSILDGSIVRRGWHILRRGYLRHRDGVSVLMTSPLYRSLMGLGRRLFFGTDQNSGCTADQETVPVPEGRGNPGNRHRALGSVDRWVW